MLPPYAVHETKISAKFLWHQTVKFYLQKLPLPRILGGIILAFRFISFSEDYKVRMSATNLIKSSLMASIDKLESPIDRGTHLWQKYFIYSKSLWRSDIDAWNEQSSNNQSKTTQLSSTIQSIFCTFQLPKKDRTTDNYSSGHWRLGFLATSPQVAQLIAWSAASCRFASASWSSARRSNRTKTPPSAQPFSCFGNEEVDMIALRLCFKPPVWTSL